MFILIDENNCSFEIFEEVEELKSALGIEIQENYYGSQNWRVFEVAKEFDIKTKILLEEIETTKE